MHGTLYTYAKQGDDDQIARGVTLVKVVRLQNAATEDWYRWHTDYCAAHPDLELLEIAAVDVVDERSEV